MNATTALGPIAALLAVIVLIPIVLWLLKRTPMGGGTARGPMRMVGTLALGPSQRLVTVEVGSGDERRWLVLAMGPQGVTTLHTMAPTHEDAASSQNTPASMTTPAPMPAFARMLAAQQRLVATIGKHGR